MIFEWGDDELAHFLELAKSRELVEQRGCVFSEFRMGREQAVVGVCAGRGVIVIAGAQNGDTAGCDRLPAAQSGRVLRGS